MFPVGHQCVVFSSGSKKGQKISKKGHRQLKKLLHLEWVFSIGNTYTLPTKIKHPRNNIRLYWTNFCLPTVRAKQSIFEQTLIEAGSLHLYASFAPFASKLVNYSRHTETLNFRKNSKSTSFSFENSNFTVFMHFSIVDQLRRKGCQKKRKDVSYQLPEEFVQNYSVVCELWAGKSLFTTYVWNTLDVLYQFLSNFHPVC